MSDVSPEVKHRLELLGLACKFEGELLITYDGLLVMGREKTAGQDSRPGAEAAGGNALGGRPFRRPRRKPGTAPRAGFW
jgi:hypothetical protein